MSQFPPKKKKKVEYPFKEKIAAFSWGTELTVFMQCGNGSNSYNLQPPNTSVGKSGET